MKLTIIIIFGLSIMYGCGSKSKETKQEDDTVLVEVEKTNTETNEEMISATQPTVNIQANNKITSPQVIEVNSEGVWHAYEGELGTVQLIDNNGTELTLGILSAKGEWMKSGPVMFSTELTFDSKKAKKGKLIIHNNPGDGDGDEAGTPISFEIPVIF